MTPRTTQRAGERDDKYCVHCGRHPTAFQEVQALRETIEQQQARIEELEAALREHTKLANAKNPDIARAAPNQNKEK